MQERDYFEMNRKGWDKRTAVHIGSKFYDVAGFLKGQTSLREIELNALPDVAGKSLLHLQCHFGMDTLSWARQGAQCTGVDISPAAIAQAEQLAKKTNLNAEFICSDLYSFKRTRQVPYDIVFTSYGTICWLPDLTRWAEIVSDNLATGGRFFIADFHPIYDLLAGYSYFTRTEPDIDEEGTYTDGGEAAMTKLASWSHPISEQITALINAGIDIDQVQEFPFSPYDCFEGMTEREPGRFYMTHKHNDVPIVYTISGIKRG